MPPSLARLWTRILTGDGMRPSRLHTMRGERIDLAGMAHLPRAILSTALLKLFGYRQRRPWLGYRAAAHLGRLIRPAWNVLEFGSGASSLFFAQRAARLVTVESDPDWYARVRADLSARQVNNAECRLLDGADYATCPGLPDRSFDLAVIDGIRREESARAALRLVKPGGFIFLDNSDAPEYMPARELLSAAGTSRVFIDFHPLQVQVNESIIIHLPD